MLSLLLTAAMCVGAPAKNGAQVPNLEPAGEAYTPQCKVDKGGYCTDKALYVDLDQGRDIYLRINTAVGDVVSLLFPEGVTFLTNPTVGNKAVYKLEAREHALDLFVMQPGQVASLEAVFGHRTVIQIDAKGGARRWHITLDVIVAPEDLSVRAVSFRSVKMIDEEAYVKERIEEAVADLRKQVEDKKAELGETAEGMAYEVMTGMYAQGNTCSDSHTPSNRADGLWAHVLEVCRTGDRIFVQFELRNSSRNRFEVGLVELVRGADSEGTEAGVDSIVRFWAPGKGEAIDTLTVAHRQTVRGAISIEATDEADKWGVRFRENSGTGRVLVVDGLRF